MYIPWNFSYSLLRAYWLVLGGFGVQHPLGLGLDCLALFLDCIVGFISLTWEQWTVRYYKHIGGSLVGWTQYIYILENPWLGEPNIYTYWRILGWVNPIWSVTWNNVYSPLKSVFLLSLSIFLLLEIVQVFSFSNLATGLPLKDETFNDDLLKYRKF